MHRFYMAIKNASQRGATEELIDRFAREDSTLRGVVQSLGYAAVRDSMEFELLPRCRFYDQPSPSVKFSVVMPPLQWGTIDRASLLDHGDRVQLAFDKSAVDYPLNCKHRPNAIFSVPDTENPVITASEIGAYGQNLLADAAICWTLNGFGVKVSLSRREFSDPGETLGFGVSNDGSFNFSSDLRGAMVFVEEGFFYGANAFLPRVESLAAELILADGDHNIYTVSIPQFSPDFDNDQTIRGITKEGVKIVRVKNESTGRTPRSFGDVQTWPVRDWAP